MFGKKKNLYLSNCHENWSKCVLQCADELIKKIFYISNEWLGIYAIFFVDIMWNFRSNLHNGYLQFLCRYYLEEPSSALWLFLPTIKEVMRVKSSWLGKKTKKHFNHTLQQWTFGLHILWSIWFNLVCLPTAHTGRGMGRKVGQGNLTYPSPRCSRYGSFGKYHIFMASTAKNEGHNKTCSWLWARRYETTLTALLGSSI